MGKADKEVIEKKIQDAENLEKKEKRKKTREKLKKERVSFMSDFKKFITKGNVLDMAVGVVIGTAFNAIVNGLVKQVITPFVTYFTSGVSIDEWKYVLKEEVLDLEGNVTSAEIASQYGLWIQSIIDFLIIAFTVFVMVRVIRNTERRLRAKELAEEAEAAAKKKAAEEEKAAAAKAEADAKAAAEKAALEEFYANVKEQSRLLREISESVKK